MISTVGAAGTPAWVPMRSVVADGNGSSSAAGGSDANGAATTAASSGAASLSAERDVTGQLQLTTRDGDTVTISASVDETLTYGPDGSTGGQKLVAGTKDSLSVQVSGSLDRRELRDIERYVRRFLRDLRGALRTGNADVSNLASVPSRTLQSVTASIDTNTQLRVA